MSNSMDVRETVSDILHERMELKDFNEYKVLVSEAYEAAPTYDPSVVSHWHALNASNKIMLKRFLGKYKVEYTPDQPYETADEMRADFRENGVLRIYNGESEHPIFSVEDNLIFRTVHDYFTHILRGQNFTLRGELAAYNTHSQLAPADALPALFTEVVGQVCFYLVNNYFAVQKVAVLEGFDFRRVGVVEGYDIRDKELVKAESQASDACMRCKGYIKKNDRWVQDEYRQEARNIRKWCKTCREQRHGNFEKVRSNTHHD